MTTRCTVLVVDDDSLVLAATARLLADHCEVLTALSVDEAAAVMGGAGHLDGIIVASGFGAGCGAADVLRAARATHPQARRLVASCRAPRRLLQLLDAEALVGRVKHGSGMDTGPAFLATMLT